MNPPDALSLGTVSLSVEESITSINWNDDTVEFLQFFFPHTPCEASLT